jgi:hypothetical protein
MSESSDTRQPNSAPTPSPETQRLGVLVGRQVRNQRREFAVCACRQGSTQPPVELVQTEPAIARGNRQHLDDPVPIIMGRTQVTTWQVTTWHQLIAAGLRGCVIRHG